MGPIKKFTTGALLGAAGLLPFDLNAQEPRKPVDESSETIPADILKRGAEIQELLDSIHFKVEPQRNNRMGSYQDPGPQPPNKEAIKEINAVLEKAVGSNFITKEQVAAFQEDIKSGKFTHRGYLRLFSKLTKVKISGNEQRETLQAMVTAALGESGASNINYYFDELSKLSKKDLDRALALEGKPYFLSVVLELMKLEKDGALGNLKAEDLAKEASQNKEVNGNVWSIVEGSLNRFKENRGIQAVLIENRSKATLDLAIQALNESLITDAEELKGLLQEYPDDLKGFFKEITAEKMTTAKKILREDLFTFLENHVNSVESVDDFELGTLVGNIDDLVELYKPEHKGFYDDEARDYFFRTLISPQSSVQRNERLMRTSWRVMPSRGIFGRMTTLSDSDKAAKRAMLAERAMIRIVEKSIEGLSSKLDKLGFDFDERAKLNKFTDEKLPIVTILSTLTNLRERVDAKKPDTALLRTALENSALDMSRIFVLEEHNLLGGDNNLKKALEQKNFDDVLLSSVSVLTKRLVDEEIVDKKTSVKLEYIFSKVKDPGNRGPITSLFFEVSGLLELNEAVKADPKAPEKELFDKLKASVLDKTDAYYKALLPKAKPGDRLAKNPREENLHEADPLVAKAVNFQAGQLEADLLSLA